jgi:L-lysine 2,3-aminomutase
MDDSRILSPEYRHTVDEDQGADHRATAFVVIQQEVRALKRASKSLAARYVALEAPKEP